MITFSKREALRFGWDAAIANIGFFVVALLIAWIAQLVLRSIGGYFTHADLAILAFLFSIAAGIVGILTHVGFIKIGLKLVDGGKPVKEDFRPTSRQFWTYLGACILVGIGTVIGLVLLIVPGIMFAVASQFYGFFVIEKGMDPVQAIKASWAATKGSRGQLFIFDLVCVGVTILGAIALGIGLFVAIPTVLVAMALVYRKFASHAVVPV